MANPINPSSAEKLNPTEFGRRGGTAGEGENAVKYNVGQLTYPETAGSDEYPHYVGFFINIRGKSRYKKDYKTTEVTTAGQNRADRAKLATNAATLAGAAVGGSLAAKILGNSKKASLTTKVIGTAAGAVVGAAAAQAIFEPDKTYRIDSAVMLAVNERPSVQYQVEYQAQDMGALGGIVAGGTSVIDSGYLEGGGEAAKTALLNLAQIPAGVAQAMGANVDAKNLASVATGMTQNPFREQVFQNVQTRTFNFDYKFLPRSERERETVQLILRMFRFHMHPELSDGGLFYIYPSEFDIVYYYKGRINPYINKISTCVLQSMNVDYGGQGQFGSFADGSPTEINLRLNFVELEVLTKERVNVGY
jgi:hypothetical protein